MEGHKPYSAAERTERYKLMLLDIWENIRMMEAEILSQYLAVAPLLDGGKKPESIQMSDEERYNMNRMLALAIILWRELTPKMRGKTEIEAKFKSFEKDNREPSGYIGNMDRIFELTDTLRDCLELLEVTKFEKEVK